MDLGDLHLGDIWEFRLGSDRTARWEIIGQPYIDDSRSIRAKVSFVSAEGAWAGDSDDEDVSHANFSSPDGSWHLISKHSMLCAMCDGDAPHDDYLCSTCRRNNAHS